MMKSIELDAPNPGSLEKEFLCKAIDSGYVSTIGPFVPEFEKKFGQYLKINYGVGVQSGTRHCTWRFMNWELPPGMK